MSDKLLADMLYLISPLRTSQDPFRDLRAELGGDPRPGRGLGPGEGEGNEEQEAGGGGGKVQLVKKQRAQNMNMPFIIIYVVT